jgi:excisionase family DNA binding protein
MKVSELAKQLGMSESTIYRLVRKGIVEANVKQGKSKFTPNRINITISEETKNKLIKIQENKINKLKLHLNKLKSNLDNFK